MRGPVRKHGGFSARRGREGKEIALPHSEVMIHQASGGTQGQATDIRIQAERIMRMKEKLNEILAANTGKPIEQIEAGLAKETTS